MKQKKIISFVFYFTFFATFLIGCSQPPKDNFKTVTEQFADIRILRYEVPAWEKLTQKQRMYAYYLTEAGLSGRDIMWSQNYRHNLTIRKTFNTIISTITPKKDDKEWNNFLTYAKRIWFSNGIHHHYSMKKISPEFSREYLKSLLEKAGTTLSTEILDVLFSPTIDSKKVELSSEVDLVKESAINFYAPDVTQAEVEEFYKNKIKKGDKTPISYGLNSRIIKENGVIKEDVYSATGLYGNAIKEIIKNLSQAKKFAENDSQVEALETLIQYYTSGDLKLWDKYNIQWVKTLKGDVDYINGFIEVYNDPLGYRGSYETIVQITDFEASERMSVLNENVQWFEDNSPIQDEHKKSNISGVSYKIIQVVGEAGDASPSTPIGVNLPNANWIRQQYGSKSVSLGNIESAYHKASGGKYTNEFVYSKEEKARSKKYGSLASKMHTALHEVIGHASGKINEGIGTPKETLKNYASALEEGRADLVALYFMMDKKLIDIGLFKTLDAGKAEYDSYIRNGLMVQLWRIEKGENIEEAHMRNRQMIAKWSYEKGKVENVIEKKTKDGKTFFVINDYEKLRTLFGELLQEVQRIKSEGDYEAGKNLIETYGVQVDEAIHKEVLERAEKLKVAPYSGFINPRLIPVIENDEIKDVRIEYPKDFLEQMLEYDKNYSFL